MYLIFLPHTLSGISAVVEFFDLGDVIGTESLSLTYLRIRVGWRDGVLLAVNGEGSAAVVHDGAIVVPGTEVVHTHSLNQLTEIMLLPYRGEKTAIDHFYRSQDQTVVTRNLFWRKCCV